jgi:hypothetical protein
MRPCPLCCPARRRRWTRPKLRLSVGTDQILECFFFFFFFPPPNSFHRHEFQSPSRSFAAALDANWTAEDAEAAIHAAGGVAAVVRTWPEWEAHPQHVAAAAAIRDGRIWDVAEIAAAGERFVAKQWGKSHVIYLY